MKRYKRAKMIFAAFLATCILFFTNDCQLIDVQKIAIIVALGIDLAQNELEITAQIAIPQATDTQTSNSDAVLSAKGKTLFDALDNIGVTTGWYPKLAFCNLIIFGNELIKKEFMPIIDYMLTSYRFVNSAILAAADGKAKDILSSPTPLDYVSAFALEKILVRDIDRANTVLVTDIREFAANVRSPSGFSYMPLVKKIKTDDKPKGDSSTEQGQAQSSNSNQKWGYKSIIATSQVAGGGATGKGGQESEGAQKTVFDARSTVFFNRGVYACTIDDEQTLCLNTLNEPISEAFFDVDYTDKNGRDVSSVVSVVGSDKKRTIKEKNGLPVYTAELTLYCKNEEITAKESTDKLARYTITSKECLTALEKKITAKLNDTFIGAKTADCDVLTLKNLIYRHMPKKYPTFKDDVLNLSKINFIVRCKNKT